MSNPFDQFESDIHAALPPVGAPPPSLYGPPPPPMGQPPMMPHQPPPMQAPTSSGGSFYGAHGDNPYGAENQYAAQPPTYQQPVAAMDPFASYGAPPPQKQQQPQQQAPSSPGVGYTAQPPYGYESAPQQVPSAVYMNQPPEAASYADPWGGPPVEAAPPAQQPPAPPMSNMQALVPSQQHPSNPYGMPPNPYGTPNNYGAPEQQAYVAPPSMEQQQQQQQSYAVSPPEQNFSGGPPEQNAYGAPNLYGPPEPQPLNPYGMPSDPSASSMSALVPSHQPTNPYAPPAQAAFGAPVYGYGPPPPPPPVDPFSVFESQSRAPAPTTTSVALVVAGPDPTASDDDFWSSFGANAPAAAEEESEPPVETAPVALEAIAAKVEEEKKGEEGLPPGGEWYDARIFTPTLGVMFFKPQELTDSLFLNTDKEIVDALGDRPVVAFIVEGSSARSAGVELGHVLLKVNNVDVRSPKEASRLIKEGPRPLPLLFYIPGTDVVVAEGEHMVKYDTRETTAPNSAKDWKPKYVVIGGIIAQPWMMNMYRSKVRFGC